MCKESIFVDHKCILQQMRRKVEGFILLNELRLGDSVSICNARVSVSFEKPPRFPDMGVGLWVCECGPGRASCVHVHVCVVVGTPWDLLGQFLESTTQLIDIGSSWAWCSLAHCQMWPALPVPEAL